MADSLHRQLLQQARRLAKLDARRPQQVNLRRAISSAYYALFRFFVDCACREFVGSTTARKPYRDIMSRAFGHAEMAAVCKSFAGGTLPQPIQKRLPSAFQLPAELRSTAETFLLAQEKRHLADYDPAERFDRADAITLVAQIEQAIAEWKRIQDSDEARFFLTCLLTWSRLSSRS